jgi:rSAM/selenodomain-associated transferase 2
MLSVIIPARNEAEMLPRTLAWLRKHLPDGRGEIIVAEEGSAGETAAIAAGLARVVHAADGSRAALLNAGAAAARGEILFFVHADSFPPATFAADIAAALADPRVVGGAFAHRFLEPAWGLRAVSWINRRRYWLTRNYYGDQGIFVRREVFERIGGFPPRRLMEDLAFSQRLKREGRTWVIPNPMRTSGRRFLERGIWRTFFFMGWLLIRDWLGLDTERYALGYHGPSPRPGYAYVRMGPPGIRGSAERGPPPRKAKKEPGDE